MREVLFRGKRLDNGDWVDGYLYEHEPPLVGIVSEKDEPEASKWFIARTGFADWNMPRPVELVEVDPSTVCQYTGLKDKNGERIFEGDMIKPFDDEIDKMVVEFHYGQFLLCLYGERGYLAEYGWEEEGNYGCFESEPLSSYGDGIEIIGNIHDNPEFMKGDADNG